MGNPAGHPFPPGILFSGPAQRTVSGWVTGLNTRGDCEIFYAFEVDGVTYQSTCVSRYMTKPKGSSALCSKARLLEKGWTVPVTFPVSQPEQAIAFARAPRLEVAFLLAALAAWLVEWRKHCKAEGPGKRVSPLSGP